MRGWRMAGIVTRELRRTLQRTGDDIVRMRAPDTPAGIDAQALATIRASAPFTMTNQAKVFALVQGIRYIVRNGIPGDFVECGVWRGGSTMAAARTLLQLGDTSRHLYLFDTFEGMPPPSEKDIAPSGRTAAELLAASDPTRADSVWCVAALDDVKANLARVGYPADRIHFIKGKVEDTVPGYAPDEISLLRLDTDWYESTLHEMEHLYPRVVPSGVLIVDDYGWWKGAQQAVDEYVAAHGLPILLTRLGEQGGVIGVVPGTTFPNHDREGPLTVFGVLDT